MSREFCPACDYDLRGNPIDSKCPECGFVCATGDTCLRPTATWQRYYTCGMFVLLGLFVHLLIDEILKGFPTWPPFGGVIMAMMVLWPLSFLYRHYVKYRYPYEFILLSEQKLIWRLSGQPEFTVSWVDIEKATSSKFLNTVVLHVRDSSRRIGIPRQLRPRTMRLEEFTVLVERYCLKHDIARQRGC